MLDLILDEHRVRRIKSDQNHDHKIQDGPIPDTDHDDADTDVETFLQENLDSILAIPLLNTAVNGDCAPRSNESIQLWNFIFGTFLTLKSGDDGTNEGGVR